MNELHVLLVTAISLGFIHTLLGPDHYLPFIVLSKARKWSLSKTLWITFFGGVGHIVGSVVLGITGVALGISVSKLEMIEASRSNLVAWMLIVFGFFYTIFGVIKYLRNGHHAHLPKFLLPKSIRRYRHLPTTEIEEAKEDTTRLTPWILFLIFVFGPCEVLIPLLIYPASQHNMFGVFAVAMLFGIATISTMLFTVFIGFKGTSLTLFKKSEKYMHMIAGLVILFLGLGIRFWGW
ncbi:MAG: sulfite exporter TauE/SafE family protein [Bacteroidia bacterium]|nr:sulfite exporter TauE/SafE family protein [Bacteroidia bacterium]